ncbi:MAG: PIN domain-containing protein [Deltaproteobacteria bacterium]|nr:PIN domain-containing protein [Deltaproteobacteria bacterium]
MAARFFVDTNVLVYAHDAGAGAKHEAARSLVERLWEERAGVLSTQVLQEFYVNVRRKALRPMPLDDVRQTIEDYLRWTVIVNDGGAIIRAMDLADRCGISFWDGLIADAANQAGAKILYSEDLNHGQEYGSVRVTNPFLT